MKTFSFAALLTSLPFLNALPSNMSPNPLAKRQDVDFSYPNGYVVNFGGNHCAQSTFFSAAAGGGEPSGLTGCQGMVDRLRSEGDMQIEIYHANGEELWQSYVKANDCQFWVWTGDINDPTSVGPQVMGLQDIADMVTDVIALGTSYATVPGTDVQVGSVEAYGGNWDAKLPDLPWSGAYSPTSLELLKAHGNVKSALAHQGNGDLLQLSASQ